MGRFETYSKRKLKVTMVLFACVSWPWKAALTKTQQKSNSLPESIFHSRPQWESIPAPISISYWAAALNTARVSGGPSGGTSAGEELWLSRSGCTVWSCDTSACRAALLRQTGVCWIPSRGFSATSAGLESCGEAGSCSEPAWGWAATHSPAHTRGSSDSGSKSWYVAGSFWHLRYFHALYNLCKLKCQGVINYVAVHSLHFIYKKGLKTGSKKAQTWEIT